MLFKFRYIKEYPFSIIIILVITYLTLSQPMEIGRLLFKGWDKFAHFAMYGTLSGVFWIEFLLKHRKKQVNYLYAMVGGVLYPVLFGGFLEICQRYFTHYRSGDWWDFLSNMGGVVLATLIAWYALRPWIMKNS